MLKAEEENVEQTFYKLTHYQLYYTFLQNLVAYTYILYSLDISIYLEYMYFT